MQDRVNINNDIIKVLKEQNDKIRMIDSVRATSKIEELKDAFIELTSVERVPLDFVKIRRDKTSDKGKMRRKIINVCSNVVPNQIFVNGTFCPFKITKVFKIIKIDVESVCSNLPSGWYNFEILFCYGEFSFKSSVKVDFRARGHNKKKRKIEVVQRELMRTEK